MEFIEVEHKYIVPEDFDLERFRSLLLSLHPERTTEVQVEDSYYVLASAPQVIFRHRYDRELQELSLKSRAEKGVDIEARKEVNLKLDRSAGNQQRAVTEFLGTLGITWQGTIHKDLHVFYFPDCEVVYYVAQARGACVRCVEFEARGQNNLEDARAILTRYEEQTGFAEQTRAQRSLFDLLLTTDAKVE